MRLPNIFTSVADVMAGYLIVTGPTIMIREFSALLISTACIYGAGCALNDLHDRDLDSRERPSRPIPSGRVSDVEATVLTCALFTISLAAALIAGKSSFFIAAILVLSVVSYDLLLKDTIYSGSGNMALCRSLNLLLGMSPALGALGFNMVFPMISFVYIFSLTVLSRFETKGSIGTKAYPVVAGYVAVIITMISLILTAKINMQSTPFLILFIIFTMPSLFSGLISPALHRMEIAVKYLVLGVPLLDAVYVSGVHGWRYGIPVMLCTLVSMLVARFFYVT